MLKAGGFVHLPVADGRKVCVLYDYAAGRKRELDEALRALLRAASPGLVEEV